ncbi:filamentous hemagglutinin N-terminal domain-containing protein [Pantanalinema sp. GBBB05]|uniref:two-partner secretion domain-containing protein n=1 Tax=Pantanalinema sp. GBBB05 TaxID=2604139 RepID=UPI001D69C062|nr:S-layer family protein [Pantanalinema sp. GBBB05]
MRSSFRWWQFRQQIASSLIITLLTSLAGEVPAHAQITSDGTLSTTVSQFGNNFSITNGSRVGNNLFHSFRQFSVPTGGAAFFNNATTVQNIISRVTGGSVSNIDGLIRANGQANLFLINPAGIIFGPNASVFVGGSFVASTANNVIFADGTRFNTTDTTSTPLLSISAPIGLQLGPNAGAIQTQGTPALNFFFRPPQLFLAKSVALIGSELNFNSTSLSVPNGQLDLWAVRNAEVMLDPQTGWQLTSPAAMADWGTITLRQSAYLDTSGATGGAINIRGRGLTVQEGSSIASATGAFGQGKGINVKTTEFVDLLGISDPQNYPTPGIYTSVTGSNAKAGDITIETGRLRITNAAWLQSIISFGFDPVTFQFIPINNSKSGNIAVRAADVEVIGYSPFPNSFTGSQSPSAITTLVTSGYNNESGKITIDADRVKLLQGGRISTDLLGSFGPSNPGVIFTTGKAGDIAIRATDRLEIEGVIPSGLTAAVITSIQPGTQGQSGNITIDTGNLAISNGGAVSSALSGYGAAGNIDIRATETSVSDPQIDIASNTVSGITVSVAEGAIGQGGNITLRGDRLRVFNGGQITSSNLGQGAAGNVTIQVNQIDVEGSHPLPSGYQLPSSISATSTSRFAAGSVNITADTVRVRNGADLTVSNSGSGDAGNLNISARNIFLDNQASLQAEVNGGSQGNILLQAKDLLLLRHGSKITTNARGASTGGNINIQAGFIVAVLKENSDIVANAVLGSGGNIQITTQGIFGLKYQPQLTPNSDITASSQFGINGSVQINTIDVDPSSGLVQLSDTLADPSQQIATGCSSGQSSRFVATGRGGVPQNPTQQVTDDRTWNDLRDLSAYRQANHPVAATPTSPTTIVEASGWQRHANGTIELLAQPSPTVVPNFINCSGEPESETAASLQP